MNASSPSEDDEDNAEFYDAQEASDTFTLNLQPTEVEAFERAERERNDSQNSDDGSSSEGDPNLLSGQGSDYLGMTKGQQQSQQSLISKTSATSSAHKDTVFCFQNSPNFVCITCFIFLLFFFSKFERNRCLMIHRCDDS